MKTPICKCGKSMIGREAGTPEQAWCGRWFECPTGKLAVGLERMKHYASALIESDELKAQNARLLRNASDNQTLFHGMK